MAEQPVVERGVLTAPDPMWDAAVQSGEVVGGLAAKDTVGVAAADEAATNLEPSRRQAYAVAGLATDLLAGRSSGGRSAGRLPDEVEAIVREVLRSWYLTRRRRCVGSVACGFPLAARYCASSATPTYPHADFRDLATALAHLTGELHLRQAA